MEVSPWSDLPHVWTSIGLPGFSKKSTYQSYSFDEMPPVPIELDDDFEWLRALGNSDPGRGLAELDEYAKPLPPIASLDFAAQANIRLPQSFIQFMSSPDLQSRVRSCTACYLDPGQRIVETIGALQGNLIHFLSDSQFCAHWYLHVLPTGQTAVLGSDDPYCFLIENAEWIENPACRLAQIDLATLDFRLCASTFSEFIFRFWIENEIWYALHDKGSGRPLSSLETIYLAGRN
jgi:hypothetical protein